MYKFSIHSRVQYGDTDQMGYLYHGNYAKFYELGRVEALRDLGITYRQMEEEHRVLMPVLSLNMRFVRPAYYDDLLKIEIVLKKLPNQFIIFQTEIFNPDNELVNGGTIKLGFLNADTRQSISAPESLISKLKPYF